VETSKQEVTTSTYSYIPPEYSHAETYKVEYVTQSQPTATTY